MMLVDTSGLLAAMFPDQRRHAPCARTIRTHPGPFMMTPFVLAELDYLVSRIAGVDVSLDLLDEVAAGAYRLVPFSAHEVALARDVIQEYRDLELGLADASTVVVARASRCTDLLTLDERHFRAVTGPAGQPFRIHPADS